MTSVSPWIAFIAGLLSFLSPCVLPIVPGFLAFLAGTTVKDARAHQGKVFLTSVFFVMGFSMVFASLGILLNTVLQDQALLTQTWLARAGGILIIVFGLTMTGLLPFTFLEKEYRWSPHFHFASHSLTAFLFGAAFAAGWTPCVGPILGTVLTLAATAPSQSFLLLLSYGMGLGLPFLVVGLFTESAASWIRSSGVWLNRLKVLFGFVLIGLGILVFTEELALLARFDFLNTFLQ